MQEARKLALAKQHRLLELPEVQPRQLAHAGGHGFLTRNHGHARGAHYQRHGVLAEAAFVVAAGFALHFPARPVAHPRRRAGVGVGFVYFKFHLRKRLFGVPAHHLAHLPVVARHPAVEAHRNSVEQGAFARARGARDGKQARVGQGRFIEANQKRTGQ